jgi:hypothetical protein
MNPLKQQNEWEPRILAGKNPLINMSITERDEYFKHMLERIKNGTFGR